MDILTLLLQIITVIGISLIVATLLIMVGIFFLFKKYPIFALFLLIILTAICIVGTLNPITLAPAITGIVSAVIIIITQYRRLKKAFKRR